MRNFRADGFPKSTGDGHRSGWVAVSPEFRPGVGGEIACVCATLHLSATDAIKLMAELQTAALAADDTGETRALLRSTLANMMEAMGGDGLAMEVKP